MKKKVVIPIKELIDKLYKNTFLTKDELIYIISEIDDDSKKYLFSKSNELRQKYYSDKVFLRGLIEFTSYCKNGCYYCGINAANKNAQRYRLTLSQILECCKEGYRLGYRTFVLQGGEDSYYTDEKIVKIVSSIKKLYPDCAVTLSIGEKSYDSYKKYYDAGADRYLLRHETADDGHYQMLHPKYLSLRHRKNCLWDLKKIGYQIGAGFMVESPFQTDENLADDLIFLRELEPQMAGIGPFIPHKDTIFKDKKRGTVEKTILLIALIRLMLPKALIPATTALATINPFGREEGLKAGANVVMPNLSPIGVRKKYSLYNNKACTGEEAAECRQCIQKRIESAGFKIDNSRGDSTDWKRL